jgi:hypothetical protein
MQCQEQIPVISGSVFLHNFRNIFEKEELIADFKKNILHAICMLGCLLKTKKV